MKDKGRKGAPRVIQQREAPNFIPHPSSLLFCVGALGAAVADGEHLATIVIAAFSASVVRKLRLSAVSAGRKSNHFRLPLCPARAHTGV